MVIEQLKTDIKAAMIAKQVTQRDILRMVMSTIKNKEIEEKKPLTDDQIIKIIQKEVKQINETLEGYTATGDQEWIKNEEEKIATLSKYLPTLLSESKLKNILIETLEKLGIEEPAKNRGPVIWAIMKDYGTQVDGALLNKLISSL